MLGDGYELSGCEKSRTYTDQKNLGEKTC
jgi:hypothetical protein